MTDFPIIDTHVHLWDINYLDYPWLNDIPFLNRTFIIEDYKKASSGLNIEKIVFMQCECDPSQFKKEVEWVTEIAEKDPRLKGIIAWAPMEKGEAVRPVIEEFKTNKLVKGIRRIIQFEPDLEFCLKDDFIRGVNMLKDYDLTFDICISHIHNKSVLRFLDKCPEVPMILDHIGKPDIRNHVTEPWREEIRLIARHEKVYCKLSSLATEADHKNWTLDDVRPYAEHIIECFGMERTIFGSDWPVSSQAADIPVCVSTILKILEGASKEDIEKIFHHNAQRFYKV